MIQEKNNARYAWLRVLSCAGIFGCFAAMYAWMVPQLDMFIFAKAYASDLSSVVASAAGYGNGRLLGNITAFFFAHRFSYAFLAAAVCLTGITLLCNRIVFHGSLRTVWIPAIVFAFPCMKLTQDVYGVFAAFINYVFPVFFAAASVCLLQSLSRRRFRARRIPAMLLLFLCAAAATLFSENTTIVLLVFAVLWIVSEKKRTGKVRMHSVLHLLGTLAGSACMLLLPSVTGTAHALDDYRSGLSLRGAFGGILRTCTVVHAFWLPLSLLSVGLLLSLRKAREVPSVRFARTVFAAFPILLPLLAVSDLLLPFARTLQAFHLLPAALFAVAAVIALRGQESPAKKRNLLHFYLLLLSSVVPMLFVSQYGYRTYYITFALLTVGGLLLLREEDAFLEKKLSEARVRLSPLAVSLACVFVALSCIFTMQSAVNFDTFVIRTSQIRTAYETGASLITVPTLPCKYLSAEEQWPYSVAMILPDGAATEIDLTADLSRCEDAEAYRAVYGRSPVYTLRMALENRRFADPLVLIKTENLKK